MSEAVLFEGGSAIVDQNTAIPPGIVVSTVALLQASGDKVLHSNKKSYVDGDLVRVTAITVPSAGATIADPGPYDVALEATTGKVFTEGAAVVREGDQTEVVSATPQIPGSPPVNYPVSFRCVVDNAGQVQVYAQ